MRAEMVEIPQHVSHNGHLDLCTASEPDNLILVWHVEFRCGNAEFCCATLSFCEGIN